MMVHMRLPSRAGLLLPALAALSGCKIVTDGAPIWDMTWNVPSKSTSISVNTLLPTGVSAANNAFQANVTLIAPIVRTLGADCTQCAAANGQTIPKPAFTVSTSSSATLPSGVSSATLVTDTIIVAVNNGYNFDPINAGGTAGSIKLTATSGSTTLGTQTFSGPASTIAAGQTTTFKLPISGVVGSSGIQVTALVDSPLGSAVTIDASRQITITPSVKGSSSGSLLISGASVTLTNRSVTASATALDLSDIDKSVRKRVTGGKLFLAITNPFSVSGTLTVNVNGVSKNVTLAAGGANTPASNVVVDFTGAEMQTILGTSGSIAITGTLSGTTPVTPNQTVAVSTRLQLTLCTDSDGANACK
jgi:hypothetical protein